MKVSDLGSILEFQGAQPDGSWATTINERGNIKRNKIYGGDSYGFSNRSPSASHTITIRYRDDIERGMRVLAAGVYYTIADDLIPDDYDHTKFLEIRVYKVQKDETTAAIEAYGRDAVLLIPNVSTNDSPAFDRNRNGATPDTEVPVRLLQTRFSVSEIDGTQINATDIRFLIGGDAVLSTSMKIRDGNQTYNVINVEAVKPGDDTTVHIVQAR